MSHAGMTCKQLVELTTEYFEGTLFPPDRVRFQAHLKTCAHCASYVEQMCQTIKALGRSVMVSTPQQRDLGHGVTCGAFSGLCP